MATGYTRAGGLERRMLAAMVESYHPELVRAQVTFELLMASNPDGPALTRSGYQVLGMVRIVPLRYRVAGMADAMILADLDWWGESADQSRYALLDHVLEHVEVRLHPKTSEVRLDDAGRPRLKLRRHDWQLGGFLSVAKRHKERAVEIEQLMGLAIQLSQQLEFDFMKGES